MKEHNNFSYLWNFEPDIPNGFGEILFYGSLTFLPPSNLTVFYGWCFLQYFLQRAENFEFRWYIRSQLLWVNVCASEEKFKQIDVREDSPVTSNRYNLASALCVQTYSRRRIHNCISWPGFWGICCYGSLSKFCWVHGAFKLTLPIGRFTVYSALSYTRTCIEETSGHNGIYQLEHSSKWSDRNPHFSYF